MPSASLKLFRSMPFRLALGFTILYFLCFSVGAVLYYKSVQENISTDIELSLIKQQSVASQLYQELGLEEVIKVVDAHSTSPMQSGSAYHVSLAGETVAGNIPTCTTELGWRDINATDLGIDTDITYRFLTTNMGEHVISLGRSTHRLKEMRAHFLKNFLTTFFVTMALALIGGSILASRSHSRVRSIVSSMDSVAAGNLDARLPVSQRGDDIDNLSVNMNDALSLLQQQISSMKQVSANIAHDLKTPLNRLYIKLEQASANAQSGESVLNELDDAVEEAATINGTFEALLRIAQIEAGARKAQFTAMDLLPTLRNAIEVYEPVAEEQSQTLRLELDSSVEENAGLHLLGDKDLLLQLIVNLIENAIRYCPDGAQIVISAGVVDSVVWMSVCDNGPGVPESEREKVFERLYRLEASRTSKGSGLGLSLVKAVSDLHCGSVVLGDNEPGLCVKVTFDLDCPVDF